MQLALVLDSLLEFCTVGSKWKWSLTSKKTRNLAVFSDYTRATSLPSFERYNLIYGWNGSGKTALSRLSASLESGAHPSYPDLQYNVTCDGKEFTQQDAFPTKVKVFNTDSVNKNVKLLSVHASPKPFSGKSNRNRSYRRPDARKRSDALKTKLLLTEQER